MNFRQGFKKFLNRLFFFFWFSAASASHQRIKECLEYNPRAKILDLGCDNGGLIIQKAEKAVGSRLIWGVDKDRKKLKIAARRGIRVVWADINERLPLKKDFFDVVHVSQVVEHLENIDGSLEEVWRVLKPGGYLIIATENLAGWHNLMALFLGWQAFSQTVSRKYPVGNPLSFGRRVKNKNWQGDHRQVFTLRGLTELLEAYGFKVEKKMGAGYYPFFPPISSLLSWIDPVHGVFLVVKARKPATSG